MVQSMNTKAELTVKGSCFMGLTSTGKIMVGDKAFEYYYDRNVEDYIQIPWEEIDYLAASVYFKRYINRFAIFTKSDGSFSFSAGKRNKELLRAIRNHMPSDKMVQSLGFFTVLKREIHNLLHRKNRP